MENKAINLFSIMLAFFVMGFVDLVGIATNYIKADFTLSDTTANILPSMVFFWFLIFSVPTGMLMDRIGQKKTVVLSLALTAISLLLPMIHYSFTSMIISFSMLGIGNTLIQVSINPLLSNIIKDDRLASSLTFGQFIKAIASFLAPIIAAWASLRFGDWKFLFPIYMSIALIATLMLGITPIDEGNSRKTKPSTFLECMKLLKNRIILFSFIGIMCHVGIDVGINVTTPKILMERTGLSLSEAGLATSIYFIFRTVGCLSGSIILRQFSAKSFFLISVFTMMISMIGLFIADNLILLYTSIALVGLGNSNIFPIILAEVLQYLPDKKNEVSGLMIMGLIGGTIFPLMMGISSDLTGSQVGALFIVSLGVAYLGVYSFKQKTAQ